MPPSELNCCHGELYRNANTTETVNVSCSVPLSTGTSLVSIFAAIARTPASGRGTTFGSVPSVMAMAGPRLRPAAVARRFAFERASSNAARRP